MLSVPASMDAEDSRDVEGPNPEDVMRHYLRQRAETLTNEVAADLLGMNDRNLGHVKRGRNKITMAHVAAVSSERTCGALFRELGKLADQVQRGELKIKTRDAAVTAGKQKQLAAGGPPRDRKAKEGAEPTDRPAKRSPGKSRQQSASLSPSGHDPRSR